MKKILGAVCLVVFLSSYAEAFPIFQSGTVIKTDTSKEIPEGPALVQGDFFTTVTPGKSLDTLFNEYYKGQHVKEVFTIDSEGFVWIGDQWPDIPVTPTRGDLVVAHDLIVKGNILSPSSAAVISKLQKTNGALVNKVNNLERKINALENLVLTMQANQKR
ncbi:MAG: hypothetical protein HYY61_06960 [Deltaproteobacteria bacterium]|nr:hypothetical protein [Deltaproteobacteria bacterium]